VSGIDIGPIVIDEQFINGCDNWLDGWFGRSWKHCCDIHDIVYTYGGDWWQRIGYDIDLGVCVFRVEPIMGVIMAVGTLLFGWLFFRYNGLTSNISEWFSKIGSRNFKGSN
jgi:hypothetical protein